MRRLRRALARVVEFFSPGDDLARQLDGDRISGKGTREAAWRAWLDARGRDGAMSPSELHSMVRRAEDARRRMMLRPSGSVLRFRPRREGREGGR